MLSLDGDEHRRHRDPFARPFRLDAVTSASRDRAARGRAAARRDRDARGGGPARRARRAAVGRGHGAGARARRDRSAEALGWYADIVAEVTAITAGERGDGSGREAFARLCSSVEPALDRDPASSLVAAAASDAGGLTREQVASNAAVLLFGGIETTEAMIANAFLHLLGDASSAGPGARRPSACWAPSSRSPCGSSRRRRCSTAMRRATRSSAAPRSRAATSSRSRSRARTAILRSSRIPTVSTSTGRTSTSRSRSPRAARLSRHAPRPAGDAGRARARALERLPGLRLDPARPAAPRGLVFRKPPTLHAVWDPCTP